MKKLVQKIVTILTALTLIFIPALSASALSEETWDYFDTNNIFYYNPDGCNSSASATHLAGDTVAEVIWNYLVDKGITSAEVIAGVLGNFEIESGMDPYQLGNHSASYAGLVQYMHGEELRAYVDEHVPAGKSYWHQSYSSDGIPLDVMKEAAYYEMEFMFEVSSNLKSATTPFLEHLSLVSSTSGDAGARAYAELWLVEVERAVGGSDELEDAGVKARVQQMYGSVGKYQGAKRRREAAVEYYNQYKNYTTRSYNNHSSGEASENVGGNTLIIGDSITVGSTSALLSKINGLEEEHIDAVVARPWDEGTTALETALKNTEFDPTIIVFALGTNNPGSITKQSISEVLGLADDRQVVFVTNYGNNGYQSGYNQNNNLLKEAEKNNDNVTIADWYTEVSKDPSKYIGSDGVHPTTAGTELFAELINDAATEAAKKADDLYTDPCRGILPDGNGDLNATAIALAWPEHGHGLTPTDAYREALDKVGLSTYGEQWVNIGASCDAFVATVFRYSGVDPEFVCCGISHNGGQRQYVMNSGKFVEVPNKLGSLKPGDIRISEGHIEMYVEVDGEPKIASASHGDRTGEIGNFYENSATFKAYRWAGYEK